MLTSFGRGYFHVALACSAFSSLPVVPAKWDQHLLPGGWEVYTPAGFHVKRFVGIDSEPGIITSEHDSLKIAFDSGVNFSPETSAFVARLKKTETEITSGAYKKLYNIPTDHTASIDTVNHMIVITVRPVRVQNGKVCIYLYDYASDRYLGLKCENVSASHEQLALAIFKTIKLRREK